MSQRMPVVRQMHWPAAIPQLIAIATLAVAAHLIVPSLRIHEMLFYAALVYLVFCRIMRVFLAQDHKKGMIAYHAQNFQDALSHFEASYQFFSKHRQLDAWRSLLFGVSSANSLRTTALCNMAYCYTQTGEGRRATEIYRKVLEEAPDCALAKASLKMLESASGRSDSTPRPENQTNLPPGGLSQ